MTRCTGQDSLLIWLLHSSACRRAAQDSWAHKTGDSSSQLGKQPTSPWKHFLIKSGKRKWAQRALRERGDCGSSGPFSGLLEALEVGYVQSNFSSPREMKFLSTQAKYIISCKQRVSYANDKIYIDVNPSSSQETGLSE